MIVIIDNYDSFVHNLARYVRLTEHETKVIRHDDMTTEEILNLKPSAIIISPGPKSPNEAGISVDLIKAAYQTIPILGVCLGHQAIGAAFGGEVVKAKRPMHGLASAIRHDRTGLFEGISQPMIVGRYHSLVVNLPDQSILKVAATSEEGEIMAFKHSEYPVYGVQFHPESILTEDGMTIIQNFVRTIK